MGCWFGRTIKFITGATPEDATDYKGSRDVDGIMTFLSDKLDSGGDQQEDPGDEDFGAD